MTTSLVTALGARGIGARRAAARPSGAVRAGLAQRPVGLLVVDLQRCEDGVELVSDAAAAGWSVVVINQDGDRARAAAAVAAGAIGTVSTAAPLDALVKIVSDVLDGRSVMTAAERATWLALDRAARAEAEARTRLLDALTNRELEVLQQLERGRRAGEIAAEWVVAISTVRSQIRSILGKLGVNSQQRAVVLYREEVRERTGRSFDC